MNKHETLSLQSKQFPKFRFNEDQSVLPGANKCQLGQPCVKLIVAGGQSAVAPW